METFPCNCSIVFFARNVNVLVRRTKKVGVRHKSFQWILCIYSCCRYIKQVRMYFSCFGGLSSQVQHLVDKPPEQESNIAAPSMSKKKEEAANRFLSYFAYPCDKITVGWAQWYSNYRQTISLELPLGASPVTCRRVPCPERGGRSRTGSSAAARDPRCRWSRQRSCR